MVALVVRLYVCVICILVGVVSLCIVIYAGMDGVKLYISTMVVLVVFLLCCTNCVYVVLRLNRF